MKHLILLSFLAIAIVGCSDKKAIDVKVPDVGDPLITTTKETVTKHKITLIQGQMTKDIPAKYYEYTIPSLSDGRGKTTVVHDFGSRKTLYVYEPPMSIMIDMATAAIVKKSSGRKLAVAKLLKVVKGQGIMIEEFHLNKNSQPYFYCKSLIGFSGTKISESNQKGSKTTDYFALWGLKSM